MVHLNLAQDVAKTKRKKIDSCSYSGQIVYPLQQAAVMRRYGSLNNINPSVKKAFIEANPMLLRCASETKIICFSQRAVLVVYKRNVTRKFKTCIHYGNLNKMQPIKDKRNSQLLMKWPNLIPCSKLQECYVTVLLLTSTSLVFLNDRCKF